MSEAAGTEVAKKKNKAIKNPCLRCSKEVKREEKSVQCQTCQFWVHVKCQGISDELFNILADPEAYGGVCWNCNSCLASSARLERTVVAFENRVKEVENVVAKTVTELKRVDGDVVQLRRELEAEKAKNREAAEGRDNMYVTREELREREARKLNLIMHRVKEAGEDCRSGEERRVKDTEECAGIFRALGMEREAREEIKHCRRVGERGEEPRPLVVVMKTEEARRKLLEKARGLRDTEFSDVGIVPDLTIQQRREEQDMQGEAVRRNEEELTEEDRSKNWQWLVVGPKGGKRLIKGVPREYQYARGRSSRGLQRGAGRGWVTGANAAPIRGGAATWMRGVADRRVNSVELLPPLEQMNRTRLGSKRGRDQLVTEAEVEEEEMEEEVEDRSPARKK
jgi:hypothetical protein